MSSTNRRLSMFNFDERNNGSNTESTHLLLRRYSTTDLSTKFNRNSWCVETSSRQDKVGDAWHNLYSGFDTGIFYHKWITLIPSILITLIFWNMKPFDTLSSTAMHVLAIFLGFVVSLLVSHYQVSTLVAIALSILCLTLNLTCKGSNGSIVLCNLCGKDGYSCDPYKGAFQTIVSGFTSDVVWLVFCAFHIGKAVEVTGLGRRIALHLVSLMGHTVTGLGLSFCLAEFLLAPFIPSNSARGGGVIAPIVTSVIDVISVHNSDSNSDTEEDNVNPNSNSCAKYLILVAAQANLVSASMFLTGLASNPIVVAKAFQTLHIDFGFVPWLTGAFVPGFLTLILLPSFLNFLVKPENYDGKVILENIDIHLDQAGPLSMREWKLVGILLTCLTLWSTESHTGLNNALIAYLALVVLMITEVLPWDDIAKNTKAWDTLFWLSGFVVLAEQLTKLKVSDFLGAKLATSLLYYQLPPLPSTLVLAITYFASMYMFSSATGHIVALAAALFEAGEALECPHYLLVALIAYFSSLSCCMTTYSTGSFAIYFGQGHVPRTQWFKIGIFMAIFYLSIYLTIGLAWWKILGWW